MRIEFGERLFRRQSPLSLKPIPKLINQVAHEDPKRSRLERGIVRGEFVVLQQPVDIRFAKTPEPGKIDGRIAVGGIGEIDDPAESRTVDQDVIVAEIIM